MSRSLGLSAPVAALLVLGLGTAAVWHEPQRAASSMVVETGSSVPLAMGSWQGKAIDVDPRAIEILETPDVLLREYRLASQPAVWLARVSGFGQRAAFHPPELCYVGSHFEVLERGPITVPINGIDYRLMRLVIGRDGERVEAWYWFTAGDRVTANYYQQQWWLILSSLFGRQRTGTLVRLSTLLDDPADASDRLIKFLESFESILLNSSSE